MNHISFNCGNENSFICQERGTEINLCFNRANFISPFLEIKLRPSTRITFLSPSSGVGMDSLDASEQGSLNSVPANSSSDPTLHDTEVFCREPTVTSFIKSYIPSAQLVENIGSELTYVLPAEMVREGRFQDLFEDLDKNLEKLHIGSYGVSDTTLEEVELL